MCVCVCVTMLKLDCGSARVAEKFCWGWYQVSWCAGADWNSPCGSRRKGHGHHSHIHVYADRKNMNINIKSRSLRLENSLNAERRSSSRKFCPFWLKQQRKLHSVSTFVVGSSSESLSSSPQNNRIGDNMANKENNTYNGSDKDGDEPNLPEFGLILLACTIGIATGSGVVLFNDAIHLIRDCVWHGESILNGRQLLREFSEMELWPKIVMPPILAGAFVSLLSWLVGGFQSSGKKAIWQRKLITDDSMNANLPSAMKAKSKKISSSEKKKYPVHDGNNLVLRPVARAVAAAATLGSGVSLGPEGPSVDIGLSIAKGLGSLYKIKRVHQIAILAAGAGAGVAAGFDAPIAGVFFAVETVLQKQMILGNKDGESNESANSDLTEALIIAMVLLASVLAAVVSQAGLGSSPAFRVPEYRLESIFELPLYLVFGSLCGVVSASFTYSSQVAIDAFSDLRERNLKGLLPALGGLTTGVLALSYPEILYQGFDNVNSVLASSGDYAPGLLIQILVLKIISTALSKGSGLQGGIYAPSIFMGAALGSAFGMLVHAVGDPLGMLISAPQGYALVGVAAMLASNCSVPLTSVLLLFELTRDYLIIVPTLAAVGISYWTSSLISPALTSKRGSISSEGVIRLSLRKLAKKIKQRFLQRSRSLLQTLDSFDIDVVETLEEERKSDFNASDKSPGPLVDKPKGSSELDYWTLNRDGYLIMTDDVTLSEAFVLMDANSKRIAMVLDKNSKEFKGFLRREREGDELISSFSSDDELEGFQLLDISDSKNV